MSQNTSTSYQNDDPADELRARAESLEQQLAELLQKSNARLIRAELKAEAVRTGMIDLDGLRLLDISSVKLDDTGEVNDAPQIMAQFKKAKPWLFGLPSSSSSANAPPAQAPRQKLATEMSDVEYRVARAALLKGRS